MFEADSVIFMDEIRNQFKSQTLASLVASSIQTVGGRVFPDAPAITDLEAFKAVVESWRGVHVPTYGQPIPQSGGTVSVTGAETVVSATGNQVKRVQAIVLKNAGDSAPIVTSLTQGTSPPVSLITLPDGGVCPPESSIIINGPFYVDEDTPIIVGVSSGTAGDLTSSAVVHNVVQ